MKENTIRGWLANPFYNLEGRVKDNANILSISNSALLFTSSPEWKESDGLARPGTKVYGQIGYSEGKNEEECSQHIINDVLMGKYAFDKYGEDEGSQYFMRSPKLSARQMVRIVQEHFSPDLSQRAGRDDCSLRHLKHGSSDFEFMIEMNDMVFLDRYMINLAHTPGAPNSSALFVVDVSKSGIVPEAKRNHYWDDSQLGNFTIIEFKRETVNRNPNYNITSFSYIIPVDVLFKGLRK